jgi:hypothetical protein
MLQVIPPFKEEVIAIKDLPRSLEFFKCDNVQLKRSTESDFLIPPRLLNLNVSNLRDSEEK